MKLVYTFNFFIISILFIAIPKIATASIDSSIRQEIANACTISGRSKKVVMKDLERVCACVARTHFYSAQQEPDESDGRKGLFWILKYYQISDSKTLLDFAKTNEPLVEFDFAIVQNCLEEVRGK